MKKLWGAMLGCFMILMLLPMSVLAIQNDGDFAEETREPPPALDKPKNMNNDELFYRYVLQIATSDSDTVQLFSDKASKAGNMLTQKDRTVYDILKTEISKIAAGDRSETLMTIKPSDLGITQTSWTASELGVETIVEDGQISESAKRALADMFSFDNRRIVDALLADHPYELYWYDKTTGFGSSIALQFSAEYDGHEYRIAFADSTEITFVFAVAEAYAGSAIVAESGNTYRAEVDSEKLALLNVPNAVNTARKIVMDNADKTDYQKLIAYKSAICDYVEYDYSAADEDTNTSYGNPWQLISVFDGNPNTNVVCEGYAKAFQFLCDLSDFDGDIRCYTVTGMMGGGTGAGPHMWNVLHMPNGSNYLVDVTNCDNGSIGVPDYLFLVGGNTGAIEGVDYSVAIPDRSDGIFTISGGTITYTYDMATKELWEDTGILSLSSEDYEEKAISDSEGDLWENIAGVQIVDFTLNNEDGMLTGTTRCNSSLVGTDAVFIVAFYNENGIMLSVWTKTITLSNETQITVPWNPTSTEKATLFVVQNVSWLPLCANLKIPL